MGCSARRILYIIAGAGGVLVAMAALFYYGVEGYHRRELEQHRRALTMLLDKAPTVAQIEAQFGQGFFRVAKPADATSVAHIWSDRDNSAKEIEGKVARWAETRIYFKGSLVYFIYFDSKGIMRDFSCISN
jgi:hypothetical protein